MNAADDYALQLVDALSQLRLDIEKDSPRYREIVRYMKLCAAQETAAKEAAERELAATIKRANTEAQLACDLRCSQDQVIERCAQAVERLAGETYADAEGAAAKNAFLFAAKQLRAHIDGISGEDWGELSRSFKKAEAERDRAVRSLFSPYHVTEDSCGACRACGHYVENFESFMKPSSHRSDCVWLSPAPSAKDDLCETHGYVSKAICPECSPAPTTFNREYYGYCDSSATLHIESKDCKNWVPQLDEPLEPAVTEDLAGPAPTKEKP